MHLYPRSFFKPLDENENEPSSKVADKSHDYWCIASVK